MSLVINPIISLGGLTPTIVVTAPTGSTVTCNGVAGIEVDGTWTFRNRSVGDHIIVATSEKGFYTASTTVTVSGTAIYEVALNYTYEYLIVGGTIFYVHDDNNNEYHLFDSNKNELTYSSASELGSAYYYSKAGTDTNDKFYVCSRTWVGGQTWGHNGARCGAGYTGIGGGKLNTNVMLAQPDEEGCIWTTLKEYRDSAYGGCSDWFLGTRDELAKAIEYGYTDLAINYNWTSEEFDATHAAIRYPSWNAWVGVLKTNKTNTMLLRSF